MRNSVLVLKNINIRLRKYYVSIKGEGEGVWQCICILRRVHLQLLSYGNKNGAIDLGPYMGRRCVLAIHCDALINAHGNSCVYRYGEMSFSHMPNGANAA